jgi:hypothetical protein
MTALRKMSKKLKSADIKKIQTFSYRTELFRSSIHKHFQAHPFCCHGNQARQEDQFPTH